MLIREAIDHYHDLCQSELAAESYTALERLMRHHRLSFGDRLLSTVLRPHFFSPEEWRFIRHEVEILLGAFDKIYRRLLIDAHLRSFLDLTPAEETVLSWDRQYHTPSPTTRLDAFFIPEDGTTAAPGLAFVEYNAETPAAIAYEDGLSQAFLEIPLMRQFNRKYYTRPLPARHQLLQVLLDAYREMAYFSGRGNLREKPQIAIVDWPGVPTVNEFLLFQDYFTSMGFSCRIVNPHDMEYQNGRLLAGGDFQIDIVYKRVLIAELLQEFGVDHPIAYAVRDNAAVMVNPFRSKLLHKKLSFALLSDESFEEQGLIPRFTAAERRAVSDHIPWTRKIQPGKTTYRGQTVDLLDFAATHKDRLVLKPNDEYGGKGVVIGWETPLDAWEKLLQEALNASHLVQERVALPEEIFPAWNEDHVDFSPRLIDTDPYIFNGRYVQGCLSRLSKATLLNVTAGGGSTVPVFVVELKQ
ncbi:MAG: hypothetical protein HY326_12905 [Chloroflexi bacterium]|nr:hypothetical protein [Chloroflexota bacterium]